MDDRGEWLDADEIAASLQITKATLYKLVKEGSVPARKIGGKWRFTRASIEELFVGIGTASEGASSSWGPEDENE